jgi:Leucine-rich repeat (LRR) protein
MVKLVRLDVWKRKHFKNLDMKKISILLAIIFTVFNSTAQVNEQDSLALVALYNSTDGPNWTCGCNENWLNTPVNQWYGITVENSRVTEIYLSLGIIGCEPSCGLNGSIPPAIGYLTALKILDLSYNDNLTGSIPPEIEQLDSLLDLEISNCNLNGNIPSEIDNKSSLENLNLSDNQLTGSITPAIGNMPSLISLNLLGNQLSGSIPPEIGNLTNLSYLNLSGNQLSGTISVEILNLINIENLSLSYNQLTGSIPSEIGNLTSISSLYLSNNQLTGSIPPEIGNLTNLSYLFLSDNQLTGSIPPEIGNLPHLERVRLSDNQLTGSIPPEIGNITYLRYLYLSNNQLTGEIPYSIFNPDSIYNTSLIKRIVLNNNRFSSIPDLSSLSLIINVFKIENNKIEFDDLEPNIPLDTIDEFTYSPQDSVNDPMDTTVAITDTIQFITAVSGTANQYQWYHNNEPITGATDSILTINGIQTEDDGIYTCAVTNSLVPNLTLWRRYVHLQVDSNNINNNMKPCVNVYLKNETLFIENPDADYQLSVFTTEGRLILHKQIIKGKAYQIPCNEYAKGMFLLKFTNPQKEFTKKIINH